MDNNNRILVVDDEPDLTKVSTLALEYHGFKVDTHRIHKLTFIATSTADFSMSKPTLSLPQS